MVCLAYDPVAWAAPAHTDEAVLQDTGASVGTVPACMGASQPTFLLHQMGAPSLLAACLH